jgi:lipopolysaccharide biosynthesis glycosyltransferase
MFSRPWVTLGSTGEWIDPIDEKPFSTEFSHTRFLVPALMEYKGWALFMDCDMLFMSDIQRLFDLCDDKYAVMVVKHRHQPKDGGRKMDDRVQSRYHRKNWSSFVLWNCSHPANATLTKEMVGFMKGGDLHAFSWLADSLIGELPFSYNYISGVSPKLNVNRGGIPDVVHYTDGGPWFDECKDVPFAGCWISEYEDWQRNGKEISDVPSMSFEKEDIRK